MEQLKREMSQPPEAEVIVLLGTIAWISVSMWCVKDVVPRKSLLEGVAQWMFFCRTGGGRPSQARVGPSPFSFALFPRHVLVICSAAHTCWDVLLQYRTENNGAD